MKPKEYELFKPRIGSKHLWIFVLGFMFFPVFGVLYALFEGNYFVGALIAAFGLLIIAYIVIRKHAHGRVYRVCPDGVLLRCRGSEVIIGFDDIENTVVLDQGDLDRYILDYTNEVLLAKLDTNLKKWVKASKRYGDLTKFVSVVITETEIREGGPMNITNHAAHFDAPAVLIESRNDGPLLISPVDADGMVDAIRRASSSP